MNLMRRTLSTFVGSLIVLILSGPALAQATSTEAKPCDAASYPSAAARHECFEANRVVKTYFLAHTFQQNDANEIIIALRHMLDMDSKIDLIESKNAIMLSAPPDQQARAQKIISELDRPQTSYRLTFTLTESDAGKRLGVQHFAITVVNGQRTILKEGSRVPVSTGSGGNSPQFQYLDVGTNFDLTLDVFRTGFRLRSKVDQTSFSDEHSSAPLSQEPIIRQATLEGTALLTPGKPLTLGSLDVPGSTRHTDIEVIAEPIP